MDAESVVSSSAYLLFYRRRSHRPLGGDLSERIKAYAELQDLSLGRSLLDEDPPVDDIILPSYSANSPGSSPPTSPEIDTVSKSEKFVPFARTGRALGGLQDSGYPPVRAASNPFSTGSSWTPARPVSSFATTSSEGSGTTIAKFPLPDDESATE